ncbi:MAG: PEP-CTERM sorting domain-containing protein [Acetobacteraceae bacterium]
MLVDGKSFDPDAGLPFAAGVSFEGAGNFTGSIKPLLANIPEPAGLGVFGLGLGSLLLARRRRQRRQSA